MAFFDISDDRLALLRDLSAGLARLTWIPVPDSEPGLERPAARSAWAYPVVGVLIGAIGGLVYAIAVAVGLTPPLAAVLAVACLIGVTGALNESALASAAERVAEMMDRSPGGQPAAGRRIGATGAITLVLSLGARIGALSAIAGTTAAVAALVSAQALSLAAVVAVMHYASQDSEKDEEDEDETRPGPGIVLAAAVIAIVVAALVLPYGAGAAIVAACLCGAGMVYAASRRIDMAPGAILGATQPATEIVVLIVLAASAG